jgi:hypothetical protein
MPSRQAARISIFVCLPGLAAIFGRLRPRAFATLRFQYCQKIHRKGYTTERYFHTRRKRLRVFPSREV